MIAGGERQGDRGRDVSVQQPLLAHPVLHESGPTASPSSPAFSSGVNVIKLCFLRY